MSSRPDPDEAPASGGTPPGDAFVDDASFDYARAEDVADTASETADEETILIDGQTLRGAGLGADGATGATGTTAAAPPVPPASTPAPMPTRPTPAPAPAPAHHHGPPEGGDSGLKALRRALRTPRSRGPQLLIGLLCGLLGFFAVVQIRVAAGDSNLRNARQSDLIRILDDLNDRSDRLDREIRELQARRTELQSGTDASKAALAEAVKRRATLGILAGTVPARGPGITLRITDPAKKVDAPVLLDALQELRDAGAEAVQINGVRVVAGTAFLDAAPGSVNIDGKTVSAPYVFTVIGDPDTLDPALRIPGGVFAVLNERGATATVTAPPVVFVQATVSSEAPQYSRPVPPQ